MDSANDASYLKLEPETTKKVKSDDSRSEIDDLQVTRGAGDKLGEDELTLIFSNTWLSAQDLLNFRLVSKSWCDAATTTLRRRDACVVDLWAEPDSDQPSVYKNNANYTDENTLSQLTELICISPKFPATAFCIEIPNADCSTYTHFSDLLNFFKLHGDKIKSLRHHGIITLRCVLDILQIYAPNLEGLDLSQAEILESDEEDGSEGNALKWTSKAVSLKSLNIGMLGHFCQLYKSEFFHFLLSSLPKLGSIKNVTMETLQMVLTEGKGHLIRSFKYDIWDAHRVQASQLTKFISLNTKPKLSKVTLNLDVRWHSADAAIINSLNEFIESFKDTVRTLELLCQYCQRPWDRLLNILPMKNLKSFTLKLATSWGGFSGDYNAYCKACEAGESDIFIGIRGTFFQFQDGISAQNYFPNLMEVQLYSSLSKFNEVSPMSFFSYNSHTNNAEGSPAQSGSFPKVDILTINRIDVGSRYRPEGAGHSQTETLLVAEVFPNIRILKFKCGDVSNLSSELWTLCPNVEFMEIYGIESFSVCGGKGVEMSHFVDKVFTGYSDRMLRRLRRSAAGHLSEADNSEDFKCDHRISDLRRLKELKLKFVGKWSTQFASSVTGVHAFLKMENTKFIIFHDHDPEECESVVEDEDDDGRNKIDGNTDAVDDTEESGDDKTAKYEELIFGPLKVNPNVHIAQEKQKYGRWDDSDD